MYMFLYAYGSVHDSATFIVMQPSELCIWLHRYGQQQPKKKKKNRKKNCKCKIDVRLSLKMGGMLYMVRAALVRWPLSYITC